LICSVAFCCDVLIILLKTVVAARSVLKAAETWQMEQDMWMFKDSEAVDQDALLMVQLRMDLANASTDIDKIIALTRHCYDLKEQHQQLSEISRGSQDS
jgi:hypothetical protein